MRTHHHLTTTLSKCVDTFLNALLQDIPEIGTENEVVFLPLVAIVPTFHFGMKVISDGRIRFLKILLILDQKFTFLMTFNYRISATLT